MRLTFSSSEIQLIRNSVEHAAKGMRTYQDQIIDTNVNAAIEAAEIATTLEGIVCKLIAVSPDAPKKRKGGAR